MKPEGSVRDEFRPKASPCVQGLLYCGLVSDTREMKRWTFVFILGLPCASAASVNIQNFNHTNSFGFESLDSLLVDDSDVHSVKRYSLNVAYSYNSKPLDMKNVDNTITVRTVIDDIHVLHLGGSYRFKDNFSLGFLTALVGVRPANQNRSWKPQDSQIELNYTFKRETNWALGIIPFITVPTGDRNSYLSDESVGYGATLLSQFRLSTWNFVAGLGYRFADKAVDTIDPLFNLRERMILQLGLLKPLNEKWDALLEYKREYAIPFKNDLNPNELFAGARYAWSKDTGIFMGLGSGDLTSTKTGDSRAHVGIKFAPQSPAPVCRMIPEKREPFKIVLGFQHNQDESDTAELIQRLLNFVELNRQIMDKVRVVGHTSVVGESAYNENLSLRRAKTVTALLLKAGAPKELLVSEGHGERELLDPSNNDKAHGINRRVEVAAELKPKAFEFCE